MDLDNLRAFIAVVETGSMMSASAALDISRGTVRRRIEALEADMNTALLMRTRQGTSPTQAGALLAIKGREMLKEVRALVASVNEVGHEPSGLLRVVLPLGLPPHTLAPIFSSLTARYPDLACRVSVSDTPLDGLLGDIDVALYLGTRAPQGPWRVQTVLRTRECLLAHRDYLDGRAVPSRVEQLAGHRLLCWGSPDEDSDTLPTLSGGRIQVRPRVVSSDIHTLRRLVNAGLGIGYLPRAMRPEVSTDDLIPILPEVIGRARALRAVVPHALSDLPRIKVFLDALDGLTELPLQVNERGSLPPG